MLLEVGIYNEQAYVIYNNLLFCQHLGLETSRAKVVAFHVSDA